MKKGRHVQGQVGLFFFHRVGYFIRTTMLINTNCETVIISMELKLAFLTKKRNLLSYGKHLPKHLRCNLKLYIASALASMTDVPLNVIMTNLHCLSPFLSYSC